MKTCLRTVRLAFALATVVFLYVETPQPARGTGRVEARTPVSNEKAQAANDFGVALYGRFRTQPGNLFFSPFGIQTALSMARAGARGETAAQLTRVLGVDSPDATGRLDPAAITKRLKASGRGGELNVANSLWAQEGGAIRPEFVREIASRFGGEAKTADFRRDPDRVAATINGWVESQTKRKIRNLIPPGGLDGQTRLVLANAVYFKGLWKTPFPKADTRVEPFFLDGGGTVQAHLMRQKEDIAYMDGEGFQAVDLSYRGEDLSMLVLLPARKDGLRDLEARLTGTMLRECLDRLETRKVRCFIPRFTFETGTIDLESALAALGLTLPFDRLAADFFGINGLRPPSAEALYITSAFHKAFVDVNEKGTEAAAGSGFGFARVMAPPPPEYVDFRADHPFLFAIRDRKSGTILFLGRVADPTREG